jgi:hypothetical protein
MRLADVPVEDFMQRVDIDHDPVFRQALPAHPARELEEEVAAAILRFAKERFCRRQNDFSLEEDADESDNDVAMGEEGGDSDIRDADVQPSIEKSEHGPGKRLPMEALGHDGSSDDEGAQRQTPTPGLRAAVSADDETSYALLRPSVRHILTQLDTTLTVLHNARAAVFTNLSESDTQDEEIHATSSPGRKQAKRRRSDDIGGTVQEGQRRQKRTGRPVTTPTPREGETERQMLKRIAREKKKRIPIFSDDEDEKPKIGRPRGTRSRPRTGRAEPEPQAEDEQDELQGYSRNKKNRNHAGSPSVDGGPSARTRSHADPEKRAAKLGLRDWRDVLGAAAMAGFPSKVIARASQRCANLFGQQIEFRTLTEYPAAHGTRRMHTTKYGPGGTISSDEEEDEDEAAMTEVEQRRAITRSPSVAVGSDSSDGDKVHLSHRPRPRRRNHLSSAAQLYCPHPGCSRAIQGFTRRANLHRHLDTVHGKGTALDYMISDDDGNEVHGAVHVDGFLKPIKTRKGWREG